ncbi:LacI family DNA-binding transcriptional regulator [Lacticaseibacillus daqingensis]|uniref:LacI family DNA-binding transcriptional regulator n=1 Tax=Lacticaseibacillus daqingensis TaxID=2486014 RepID=UPI000F79C4BD|nr:LacI family DNA-binding transcriptional regulator [Lacticaseibacillus daqingensis]
MKPNLKDIAARAGVSVATVSYALNGQEGVSEATRQRILAIAASLNYTPHLSAQILATRTSKLVCALVDSYQADVTTQLIARIEAAFIQTGYQLLVTDRLVPELLRSDLFDGLIVLDLTLDATRQAEILALGLPTVFLAGTAAGPGACVVGDNVGGMKLAWQAMQASVHRRLCVLAGRRASVNSAQRLNTLRATFEDAFPQTNFDARVVPADFSITQAYDVSHTLVKQYDAFICLNDAMALGVYRAAFEAGLRVGQDLSVIGFDNLLAGAYALPGLTTIGFDPTAWANTVLAVYEAVRLAPRGAQDGQHRLIPATLIDRHSIRKRD